MACDYLFSFTDRFQILKEMENISENNKYLNKFYLLGQKAINDYQGQKDIPLQLSLMPCLFLNIEGHETSSKTSVNTSLTSKKIADSIEGTYLNLKKAIKTYS